MSNFRNSVVLYVCALAAFTSACVDDPSRISSPDFSDPRFTVVSATDVSANIDFTCAIRGGSAECWGLNTYDQAPALRAASTGYFTQVSAGGYHACALRNDGVVECWGLGVNGQAPATRAAAIGSYTSVAAGTIHTCARRTDGVIECWGDNSYGQAPGTKTAASGTFTQLSTTGQHNCALRSDGVVECWGLSSSGQAPATQPASSGTFVQVASGDSYSCALRSDGAVECWGNNYSGAAPALRTAATGSYTKVSAGSISTCALRSDGKVECWGDNRYNQAPALLAAASGTFVHISAGTYHTCGIWSTGGVQCWGRNIAGESQSDIPAPLSNINTMLFPDVGIYVWFTDARNETGFTVQRRPRFGSSYGEWVDVAQRPANFSSFVDKLVVEGYTYQYRARACNQAECTPWKASSLIRAQVQSVPAAPTGLYAGYGDFGGINLIWSHTGDNESSFNILRRSRSYGTEYGTWMLIGVSGINSTTYNDTDITPAGTAYQYRVDACNKKGCSSSNISPEVLNETIPSPTTNMRATAITSTRIDLAWTDNSPNESAFKIERRTIVGGVAGPWTAFAQTAADVTAAVDTTAVSGTTYRYRIRACNLAGCSTYDTSSAVTTP
jgi:alpha-tubulin suppressor-like RCC1 family protein